MAFSPQQVERIISGIDAALANGKLNGWQTKFLTDIRARCQKYGTRMHLSEKQREKLFQILGEQSVVAAPLGYSTPTQWPRRANPRRSVTPTFARGVRREFRWLKRRFIRDFAITAALLAGAGVYTLFDSGRVGIPSSVVASSSTPPSVDFSVTDGDTVHVFGERKGTRLVGFNAPETLSPQCDRERELGLQATARLKDLVRQGNVELRKVACSCKPGTEGTNACNHGRSCGVLYVNGRDVGDILIREGLAVPFVCGLTRCPPTPRPWCS